MSIKTYTVEGMSCMHCVKHVTHALLEVEGVKDAKVSLSEKTALVNAEGVEFSALKAAVAEAGYTLSEK